MSRPPFFSIVIPSLNRGALLERCLTSLCAQDFSDYEIIVVDAGSTDSTAQVLERFASRAQAIVARGIGVSDGRNVGVQHASGQFIVFVDSDDLLLRSALRFYASLLEASGGPRLILAAFQTFSDERELATLEAPSGAPVIRQFATYLDAAAEGHLSGTHRLIIERAVYLDAGGLDPGLRVCEDQDFGLRINHVGPCALVLSPVTIGYRRHGGNISGNAESFGFGARWLIRNERRGAYPGGATRRRIRRAVITRTARSASIACLDQARYRQAIAIYLETFRWHVAQARLKYLAGFPLKTIVAAIAGAHRRALPSPP